MDDTTGLHRCTDAEKRKVEAIANAASAEAVRQGIPGVAIVVVLEDREPLLTGAVIGATGAALAALLVYGPEQLKATMERMAAHVTSGARS